jgi:cob(I)alamin adenosyltransferase
MKIYTKTGDTGQTSLFGGDRLSKDDARIEAYGTVDELNAFVGLLRDHLVDEEVRVLLLTIQNRLFTLGAHLATAPGRQSVAPDLKDEDIQLLEQAMDRMDEVLAPLRNFILPGGHAAISYAHLARTICRRAERRVVSLVQEDEAVEMIIRYLNRLSDYFFVLARYVAHLYKVEEVIWKGRG